MAKPEDLRVLKNDDEFSWVALAFSNDKKLGDDLTFPCTNAPLGKDVSYNTSLIMIHLQNITLNRNSGRRLIYYNLYYYRSLKNQFGI